MNSHALTPIIILGLAIFSMFFGAGNVIYPMDLGVTAGQNVLAWLGFILTSIGAPLIGLYAILINKGKLWDLFHNTGIKGSTLWIGVLVLALGPLGATPRCVLLSYQALHEIMPMLSLPLYSILLGIGLYFLCSKQSTAFEFLGKWLSPILLLLLFVLAFLSFGQKAAPVMQNKHNLLAEGLLKGYQTMDLLASLLFGVSIWRVVQSFNISPNQTTGFYLKASLIGASLLTLVYLCLGLAASTNSALLMPISADHYLNTLSVATFGSFGGQSACAIIFLACLTTIIALMITCSENAILLFNKVQNKKTYRLSLNIMLISTLLMANLGFEKISGLISFIVNCTYPVYITIALCSIVMHHFKVKKLSGLIYLSIALSFGYQLYPMLSYLKIT